MATFPAFTTCGIELEHMIVDSTTLSILPIADQLLLRLATIDIPGKSDNTAWSNELVNHVVELKNPQPTSKFEELHSTFQSEICRANQLLKSFNAQLMPTGMHPWMNPSTETTLWQHNSDDIYHLYDQIFNCKRHGWANLQSIHINLPFNSDDEFERLHAAIRVTLPILPALAASSPIAEGKNTGVLNYRMEVYRNNASIIPSIAGEVIPETIKNTAEYKKKILEPMYKDIAPLDSTGILQHEWLNSRGAIARFDRNAIEIRVIDTQECVKADMAVAALTVGVIKMLYENKTCTLEMQQAISTDPLIKIFLGCIKNSDQTIIDNIDYLKIFSFPGKRCTAKDLWWHLLERALSQSLFNLSQSTGQLSGTGYFISAHPSNQWEHWKEILYVILKNGPLARRIINTTYKDNRPNHLHEIYRELCNCLERGHLFLG